MLPQERNGVPLIGTSSGLGCNFVFMHYDRGFKMAQVDIVEENAEFAAASAAHGRATAPKLGSRLWWKHVLESRWILWITTPTLLWSFIAWWDWIIDRNDVSPLLIPAPGVVWDALVFVVQQPHVQRHTFITLYETLIGFTFAAMFGLVVGVVLGKVRFLERLLSPFIVATQVVPKVAVVPLFVLWFGFGVQSKIFMAALLAFFPILQNTILGVRSIERGHRDLMLVVQAPRWKRIVSLDVPSSLPYVLTGVELGMVFALTGAVVGEYLGGSEGLGAFVIITLGALKTDQLFAAVVLLTILGFMLYAVVAGIRRFAIPWHESSGLVRDT